MCLKHVNFNNIFSRAKIYRQHATLVICRQNNFIIPRAQIDKCCKPKIVADIKKVVTGSHFSGSTSLVHCSSSADYHVIISAVRVKAC